MQEDNIDVSFRTKLFSVGWRSRCPMIQCKALGAVRVCATRFGSQRRISKGLWESGVLKEKGLLNWKRKKKKKVE